MNLIEHHHHDQDDHKRDNHNDHNKDHYDDHKEGEHDDYDGITNFTPWCFHNLEKTS